MVSMLLLKDRLAQVIKKQDQLYIVFKRLTLQAKTAIGYKGKDGNWYTMQIESQNKQE